MQISSPFGSVVSYSAAQMARRPVSKVKPTSFARHQLINWSRLHLIDLASPLNQPSRGMGLDV
ncbi:unnamed protein product [Protopolystoma xenopodis]|uniref:Uncharacterized protein n=1 Tax=Protopolystoma xenopodis TaxID=117903 RepID=A0A3S5AZ41_9PLAT|nr:unnamed protein product [Protopolystoma xenopodis]